MPSLVVLPATALADVVSDWNENAFVAMAAAQVTGGAPQARIAAILHKAMFDAIEAAGRVSANGASPEAAAHSAARRVLTDLYPTQKAGIDVAYETAQAKLPAGAAKTAGTALGEKAASSFLDECKTDGFFAPDTYRPSTAPGSYVPTAPALMSHIAAIRPFALDSVSQFRPGPPPALDSALWARDYNEVKDWGGAKSSRRTAWQTETARFWEMTGAAAWNQAARALLANKPLPLADSARLFMTLNFANADASLAVFDAKYHYGFWRPVTAIRNGDRDGNDATERDAAWQPAISTPMHPEYPCAHCVQDGAAGAVLKSMFGAGPVAEFTLSYAAMPGVTRRYSTISQLEEEVSMARIWGGVHFRNSNEVGYALGRRVGEYVLKRNAALAQ
jgi:hypothetical protein